MPVINIRNKAVNIFPELPEGLHETVKFIKFSGLLNNAD